MKMVVDSKLIPGDVEGEDYDCAALESSLSSLLGFLNPTNSREQPTRAMDANKTCESLNETPVAEVGDDQPPQAAEAARQGPEAAASSSKTAQRTSKSEGRIGQASGSDNATGQPGHDMAEILAQLPGLPLSEQQQPLQLPSQDVQPFVEDVAKRTSTSSCASEGAGSSSASNVPPQDLGLKVADVCRATVRDILREVLLETLPMQKAAEVLFKVDAHRSWGDIRGRATALLAEARHLDVGPAGGAAPAGAAGLISPNSGSASLPSTPATNSPSHAATADCMSPPPPPPPPSSHGGASSPASAATTLAPLTPARSAPGAIPLPTFGGIGGGVGNPAEAAGGALSSGPGGIASGGGDGAAAAPSSALLLSLLQQHPNLMQQNPQLLASILSMSGAGGMMSVEGLAAAAIGTAPGSGSGGVAQLYGDVFGDVLAGLQAPRLSSPVAGGLRSPPSLPSPAQCGAGIWGGPLPTHGSPSHSGGPFVSPQPHGGGGAAAAAGPSGLEAFHALMGGTAPGGGVMLQGTDPMAAGYSCKTFDELSPAVRDKIQSVLDTCGPHIRAEHFDAGVRHWLLQLQLLFGELCAVSALHAIKTAANLEGVRRMKAFITTRLIDHYEQMVWAQDPQGYALRKLTPDLIAVLEDLVQSDKGLRWTHFDPKVLDTIREIRTPDAVRTRLSKLCAQELAGVQNVPAYLYTLLSKRGKTAKQAAAQKQMHELAVRLAAAQGVGGLGLGGGQGGLGGGGFGGGIAGLGGGVMGLQDMGGLGGTGLGGLAVGLGGGQGLPYGGGGAAGLGGLGGYGGGMFGGL